MRRLLINTAALAVLAAVPAGAVEPDVAALPVFHHETLVLSNLPAATGPAVELFNGHDLDDWDGWLGYADPGETYRPDHGAPLGEGGKGTMFSVVTLDGEQVLRVDGTTWGGLVNHGDYGNYHLHVEYRFSGVRHAPRLDQPENNGLLYHSHGAPGAVWGTWMRSVEFEIMTGSTGMVVPVGDGVQATTSAGHDPRLIAPEARFMVNDGEALTATGGTAVWNVEGAGDAENPVGEWNVLDLYVIGSSAIHVVNGTPVMEAWHLCDPDGGTECQPLTHGHIQIQSEGAEVFFRRITLEPIDRLPTVHASSVGLRRRPLLGT